MSRSGFFFAAAALLFAAPVAAGTLTVQVTGVRSDKGAVLARLVRPDAAGPPQTVAATSRAAQAGSMSLSFGDLPAGDYAVMLVHDENGNGRMDSNAFGVPVEGFAFSNGAQANYGAPAFDAMKVRIGDGPASTAADMTY